jgi:hypothetical protein
VICLDSFTVEFCVLTKGSHNQLGKGFNGFFHNVHSVSMANTFS